MCSLQVTRNYLKKVDYVQGPHYMRFSRFAGAGTAQKRLLWTKQMNNPVIKS